MNDKHQFLYFVIAMQTIILFFFVGKIAERIYTCGDGKIGIFTPCNDEPDPNRFWRRR